MFLFMVESGYAAITINGIDFDDNAFSDMVISTDYTGGFDSVAGYVPEGGALDLTESIVGYNLDTWIDYGIAPDGVLPEDYVMNPTQYFQLGFTDNAIINQSGYDLAIFQQGGDNGVYVSIDNNFNPENSVVVTSSMSGGFAMHMCFVDLSDLGVAEGEVIDSISLSTYVSPYNSYSYGVPEIAGAAALNSVPPIVVPVPGTMLLLMSGLIGLVTFRRRK